MNKESPTGERNPRSAGWSWLTSPDGVILDGGALTFVRHTSVTDVFRGFDIDPGSARTMTAKQALADPVLRTAGFDEGPQWIRVAESGDWTVAVEYFQQKTHVDGISSHLAKDTDVVYIAANESEPAVVTWLSRGEYVFAFECGASYDSRGGRRRHMFDDAMSDAGLLEFGSGASIGDCAIAMMTILGQHHGFTLTPATVAGPLPTAYRTHRYAPPPPAFDRG
ncbi:DUF6461 domain-containing protein [Amycolatopsis sp. EV170708-02-1]|uniref:DUF6461 domain-containing protein n=1 Tax=Amycolatopsis sp. EV170708-02-1 TaxID=2919322 RepID=UPI001F0C822B|nr:DUF6461 domain-containing protein [Amycolatopsis sp. EV170708-02-1]UMP00105.1 DUF6461 domain-containing protein [Amycolatopsis sp. EV170708-02-1]